MRRIGSRCFKLCACRSRRFRFAGGSKAFDPAKLSAVRLRFDRTAMSVICISGLGFGKQ